MMLKTVLHWLVLLWKSPILSSPELFPVRFIGVLVNGGWFASISVHFFLAINRFCAFVYATKYNRLWSESKAIVVGIVSWTFGTVLSMAHLYGSHGQRGTLAQCLVYPSANSAFQEWLTWS
uniref:7TM GPCR serpentine receptor class x (Srx) domain-containing protein n=1 Tax=Setaria digitata TaxID=48799 RepID=A0A915Q1H4_9BILA